MTVVCKISNCFHNRGGFCSKYTLTLTEQGQCTELIYQSTQPQQMQKSYDNETTAEAK